jgi:hypothetical protein
VGDTINDTFCKIDQGPEKNEGVGSGHVPWGTVLVEGVKLPSAVKKEDKIPLNKRRTKRSGKAISAVSLVIIQVIP